MTRGGEEQAGEENRAVLCKSHLSAAVKALEGKTQLTKETAVDVPKSEFGYDIESEAKAKAGYAITRLTRRSKELEKLRTTGNIDRLSRSGKREKRGKTLKGLATGNPLSNSRFLKAGFFPDEKSWYPEHEQDMNDYVTEAIDRHTSNKPLTEGHKMIIRSLDSSGNLDTKKLRSLHKKSLRDLNKNDVRRSGPSTPNVVLSILGTTVPVGERQTIRTDVAEANKTPERKEAVAAGVAASDSRKASSAANLGKARGRRGVRRSEVERPAGEVTVRKVKPRKTGTTTEIRDGKEVTVTTLPRAGRGRVQSAGSRELEFIEASNTPAPIRKESSADWAARLGLGQKKE